MCGPLTSQTHISHALAFFSRVIDDKWKFVALGNEKIEPGAFTGWFRARWGLGRRVLPPSFFWVPRMPFGDFTQKQWAKNGVRRWCTGHAGGWGFNAHAGK